MAPTVVAQNYLLPQSISRILYYKVTTTTTTTTVNTTTITVITTLDFTSVARI